jgi:hypothetical protein
MLYELLNLFLTGFLITDVVERRFPVEFKNCVIEIAFYLVYLYSKLEIVLLKTNYKLTKFIESNFTLSKLKQYFDLLIKPKTPLIYECVKDGKLCNIISTNNNESDFDFILFYCLSHSKKYINTKIIYDKNELDCLTEESDIKFLLIELKIGDTTHKIDLKTNEINYYLDGNKFTKQFFIFYLKHYLKYMEEIKVDDKFILKFIDHDVNTIEFEFTDKNEYILLEKNDYKLSNNNILL